MKNDKTTNPKIKPFHKVEKGGDGCTVRKLDLFCDRPQLTFSYPKTMSWSSWKDGRGSIEFTVEHDGSLVIKASETPDSIRGGKDVFITIPRDMADALKNILK